MAGGPGTGKSELLEWLALSIRLHALRSSRVLLHIHAHEANPLQIAAKLKALLPEQGHRQEQRHRFDEALRKPRLVAKVLLLQALDQVTQSDDQCYGLFYGLSNLLDEQLQRCLEGLAHGATMETFELVSAKEWEAYCEGTALPVTFSYQAFHQALQAAWNAYLFSGLTLPTLMSSVSDALQEQGTRPILLIDDVLCSLHQFAPDVLGAMLAAPGTWDVVCGITPQHENRRVADFFDALEAAAVGAQGSYRLAPLSEEHALNLARASLLEYRRITGGEGDGLAPFNREALVRLLRGLPAHRRTPRAFLHHLETVLAKASQDALLTQLWQLAAHEYAVLTSDRRLARLAETYGPLIQTSAKEIRLAPVPFFDAPPQEVLLPIEPLLLPGGLPDEANIAVFEWTGKREETNTVALVALRKGAARLLQETIAPERLGVQEGAPHSFLRWKIVYKGISPPILFAGEWRGRDVSGIPLDAVSPTLAYDLARYSSSEGTERRALARYLRHAPSLAPFFQAAQQYQQRMQQELERHMGMPLDQLVLILGLWSVLLGSQALSPEVAALVGHLDLPVLAQPALDQRARAWRGEWQQCFQDAFPLPHTAAAEERLQRLCAHTGREHLRHVLSVDASAMGKAFRWRGRPFQEVLQAWQQWWHAAGLLARADLEPVEEAPVST